MKKIKSHIDGKIIKIDKYNRRLSIDSYGEYGVDVTKNGKKIVEVISDIFLLPEHVRLNA